MVKYVLAAVSLACLIVGGCKKGNSLEGTWAGGPGGEKMTFAGRNFTVEAPAADKGTITLTGTYTLDKDKLSLTGTDVKMKTNDPTQQSEADKEVAQVKPVMIDQIAKANPITLVFTDQDHITLQSKVATQPRTFS